MRRHWIAALVVAGASAGCFKQLAFVCATNDDCTPRGQGTCEFNGYCSFPDPSCDDGRRYSDYSGALSSTCVPVPVPVMIGGSVSGLLGSGLVLLDNGGDDLAIAADGPFTFATPVFTDFPYAVVVGSQPSNPTQSCTVSSGAGIAGITDVVDIELMCATATYTVGGSVTGLTNSGLVITNNGGDAIPISADGKFTFPTPLTSGSTYAVEIQSQPTAQNCNISGGTGTIGSGNVTSIVVNCAVGTYTIGGTISGLTGTVVLQDNGGDNLTLNANGSFAFATPVATPATYNVTVLTQPAYPPYSQTCSVANGSGTVGSSNITTVVVTCAVNSFTIGGSVSGQTGTLVLRDNGGDDKTIAAGTTSYTFATPIASGLTYSVTVYSSPANQYCSMSNPSGTVTSGAVTNANAACTTMGISCDTTYCPVATQQCCHTQVAPATGSTCATIASSCTGGFKPMRCDDSYDCGGLPNICCATLDSSARLVSSACVGATSMCTPAGSQSVQYLCNPVDTPPCPSSMACVLDAMHGWYRCQ